jgi:integrase
MQRVEGQLRVLPPKTQRGYRTVPLPLSVVAILKRVRSEQNERRLIAGTAWRGVEGYVFDRGDGQPLDPDDLTRAFVVARTRSGVKGVRLHDLRHFFATLHMANGTNPRVVSDLLGHANVAFTMMTYSHPDADMAATAMEAVKGSLGDALADR